MAKKLANKRVIISATASCGIPHCVPGSIGVDIDARPLYGFATTVSAVKWQTTRSQQSSLTMKTTRQSYNIRYDNLPLFIRCLM